MSPENEPKPTMREIVSAEIQHQNGRNELARIVRVTNNFAYRLPRSDGRSIDTVITEGLGESIDPNKRYIDKCLGRGEEEATVAAKLRKDGWSEKRIFGTEAQFDEDVRIAIKESGVDSVAFFALMDQFIPGKVRMPSILNTAEIYHQFVLPIYIKLREMGYSQRDLY